MGKLKDQIASFFGVKSRAAGISHQTLPYDVTVEPIRAAVPAANGSRPAMRGTVGERSPAQARLEPCCDQVAVLASPSADVVKIQSAAVPGPVHQGHTGSTYQLRPQNGGGTATLSHVPLHIESATLAKLSVSQREQILRELLTRLQTGTPESRAAAAESLFSSAEDEDLRHKMSAMGAVKPLVELLKLDDVKGQMFAAYTLSALTSFEASLLDMKECRAIHALLSLLSSTTGDLSKKGALRALGRLARVDDCVYDMVNLGALPVLSDLLDSADGTIVRRCLITLYFIGADKHDMQSQIGQTEAVAKVLELCKNCSQPEIQAEAVDVIKVLSRCRECADIIMQRDGISILEEIAQHGTHSKACTCAVKALQRLAELEDARQHIIDTGGQPLLEAEASGLEAEALVEAVREPLSPSAQASACQSIIDAVREDPAYSLHLADAGVVEALVPLLQTRSSESCDVAAVALAHMSLHEEVRRRVCLAGAIPLLVRGLPTFGFRGVEGAAVCLEKLVAMREAADQMAGEPVLPGLLHVIHMGHAQASYFALRTLFLLSGVDPSLLAQLAQPQNLVLLAQRAWHGKCEAQSVALLLLRDLARVHPSQVAAPECGIVTLLIGLQASPVPEVVQFAKETIEQLVHLTSVVDEQMEQAAIEPLVQELVASDSTKLSRICERALRMLPRGLYHANVAASDACANVALSVLPGYDTEPPSVDVLILQELKLAPGQHFLEVGSGSGYLTALAAFIVGPNGSAMGVDISADAVAYAREQCTAMLAAGRFGHGVPPPKFRVRDGGTLLEIGEMWDAIVVCGDVPAPWIKTLCRLLTPCGQMVACVDGRLCCFHPSASGNDGVPIGEYGFEPMTLSRRTRRVAPAVPGRVGDGNTPNTTNVTSGRGSRVPTPTVAAVKGRQGGSGGLQPRIIGGDALTAADARDKSWGEDDIHMEQVMREIEKEQMNGLLVMADDIEVCRTPKGRKCRLGEGGFGVVYKALMNGVDEVAVKLVKAERPSAKDVELFLTEVRTLSKLHHRNIVQFYGACLDPERAMFFVTELMKGGDLYSALRHHPDTMRWERLGKKVALDVALGINYLHSRRPPLLHRDLKSPNVLLSEEGVAKIADVGMVRSQVKELVTAQPVMTPLWAAPEVMRHERASVKADIWSYGILIWEIVTGCDITEYQPLAVSRQAGKSPKGKLIRLPDNCPSVALKIFNACTSMVPDDRPTSQEIVEWLRQS